MRLYNFLVVVVVVTLVTRSIKSGILQQQEHNTLRTVVVLMEYIPSILYLWDPSNHIEHFPYQRVNQMFSTTCTFSILQKIHTFGTKVLDELVSPWFPDIRLLSNRSLESSADITVVDVIGLLRGGVPRGGGSLIFPKVPRSSLGILRVPQLPPPLNTPPPLRNPTMMSCSLGFESVFQLRFSSCQWPLDISRPKIFNFLGEIFLGRLHYVYNILVNRTPTTKFNQFISCKLERGQISKSEICIFNCFFLTSPCKILQGDFASWSLTWAFLPLAAVQVERAEISSVCRMPFARAVKSYRSWTAVSLSPSRKKAFACFSLLGWSVVCVCASNPYILIRY